MTAGLSRRAVLGGLALTGVAATAQANAPTLAPQTLSGTPDNPVEIPAPAEPAGLLSNTVIEVWPRGRVPGADGVSVRRLVLERGSPQAHDRAVMHVTQPILEVFRPERPNGAAIILLPGGGYVRLAVDEEGAGGAHRLVRSGVTAFVLNYRLPGDGWAAAYDAPLQDVQRAVRLVRSRAAGWGLDPARIGVMGFSAGSHLAAACLTRHDDQTYDALDAHDAVSARPDIVVLCYAVMSVRPRPGMPSDAAWARPLNERVRTGLAPTFILHAADDRTVPVANSLAMFQALKAADVPTEMHIYQHAGHGFGFSLPSDQPASRWPEAFEAWAAQYGFDPRPI